MTLHIGAYLLDLGTQADKDSFESAGLTSAGQELMKIWTEMDRGSVKPEQAFDAADKAVRKRSPSADKEM